MADKKTGTLKAGFGKADLTPQLPFPMAGIAGRQERLADKVHDPLYARSLAFSDGTTTAVICSVDLLMIVNELREAVWAKLMEWKLPIDGLMLTATHTHSSTGGFWTMPSGKLFLGAYRPEIFEGLVNGIATSVKEALADLAPATLTFGETETRGLNYNRRYKGGAIDRALALLTVERKSKNIQCVFFGAHPVVAAFRDTHAASADYPGELIRTIEKKGDHGMFVVGPVGGVNVLYPEGPMELEVHLELLNGLLQKAITSARRKAKPIQGQDVAFAAGNYNMPLALPRLFPPAKSLWDILALPLRLWVRKFGKGGMGTDHVTRVPVIRVGDLIFTGFPADLGAGVGLAAKKIVRQQGLIPAVVASQTDGYVGYVHLPEDYEVLETADKAALWMTIYENGMGFGGRKVGVDLLDTFKNALKTISPSSK